MPLANGQTFAGYRILRLLGSGAMGEVYLAQHPRLPRKDALKVLAADVSANAEYRARFGREADLASTLYHPHIVGVHDRGEDDGQLWISMDYVDGQDAARLLADKFPDGMPPHQVANIVTAMASALDYAHDRGLLHRDIKPANIMITTDEQRILLTDFGIARSVKEISSLTATNFTVGTVAYAAPEQLMGQQLDGRADQYALAATAYHLLTGSQLFPHSNPAVVIGRHLNATPPALAERRLALAALDPVLAKALAKNPADRFALCTNFAHALASAQLEAVTRSQHGHATMVAAARTQPATVTPPKPSAAHAHATPSRETPQEAGQRSLARKGWARVAAALGLTLPIAALALWVRPWQHDESTATGTSAAPSSPTWTTASSAPPPPSAPQPRPQVSPQSVVDSVLLTAAEMSNLLGTNVTENPAGGGAGALAMNSSAYGTLDHSAQVTPRSCVGVVFTGEHDVYGDTGFQEIKTQTFGSLYQGSTNGPYRLQQTAAVLPSAEQAQRFLTSSQTQWDACTNVVANLGFENARGFTLGSVQRDGDLMTVSMASPAGENEPDACQQALGARGNVVVETRTCRVASDAGPMGPADPAWAVPDAERLAKAILAKVKP